MNTIKHPKTWLAIALLIILLACMLTIVKRYHTERELQEKIENHSEIIDTV